VKAWIIDKLKKLGAWALGLVKKFRGYLISVGVGMAIMGALWIIAAVRAG
jgi:hypothetical protein